MDKHKIIFVCQTTPEVEDGIKGFIQGEFYEGRAFNGLFEVNPKWGSGSESKLISKKLFEKYFELQEESHLMKTSA